MSARLAGAGCVLLLAGACVSQLPEQDRRIREAVPVAKMSTADLVRDFTTDPAGARARYWGQAVEVSGTPTKADGRDAVGAFLLFVDEGDAAGVLAHLLDDDAAAIVEAVQDGSRVTLKCYCDGMDGHVVLRSCVRP